MNDRRVGKSMIGETPYPSVLGRKYTTDKYEAFATYIVELCKESPVIGTNRKARKKHRARRAAVHFAKLGSTDEALAQGVYGGLRKRDLLAGEALLFG